MTVINFFKNRIALVDDNPEISELTKAVLEQENYVVDIFSKPQDCLQAIQKQDYDVIISDYNMPGMNGLDFLKNVPKNIPTILISGEDITNFVSVDELKENCAVFLEKFDMLYHLVPQIKKLTEEEVEVEEKIVA